MSLTCVSLSVENILLPITSNSSLNKAVRSTSLFGILKLSKGSFVNQPLRMHLITIFLKLPKLFHGGIMAALPYTFQPEFIVRDKIEIHASYIDIR